MVQALRWLTGTYGAHSSLHAKHGMYIDVVSSGTAFVALDVVDVVVSKLKRFHAQDRDDVAAMVEDGHVQHARLLARLRDALDIYAHDARAADLPSYIENLHVVERDFFSVSETDIELPDWVDR